MTEAMPALESTGLSLLLSHVQHSKGLFPTLLLACISLPSSRSPAFVTTFSGRPYLLSSFSGHLNVAVQVLLPCFLSVASLY